MWQWLRWLFGSNVAKRNTVYVTLDGTAFTVPSIEAVIKSLRKVNRDLENQVHHQNMLILSLRKDLHREKQYSQAFEASGWKPGTADVEKWYKAECFRRVPIQDA
jgi:hypothetical protein